MLAALPLRAAELRSLEAEATARNLSTVELVRRAIEVYRLPVAARTEEEAALHPHISREPLQRLPLAARLAAVSLGQLVVWGWTAGRSNRSIGPRFLSNGRLRIRGPGEVRIGADVNAWARTAPNVLTTYRREASIVIGNHVRLNGVGMQAASGIRIEDGAILGMCTIQDTDHHPASLAARDAGVVSTRPIRIGRNAWVAGAILLKGVSVGDNSIIALGAVVTQDVPENVVMAGNPARAVRRLDS